MSGVVRREWWSGVVRMEVIWWSGVVWSEVMVEWCGVEGSDDGVVWREVMVEWSGGRNLTIPASTLLQCICFLEDLFAFQSAL